MTTGKEPIVGLKGLGTLYAHDFLPLYMLPGGPLDAPAFLPAGSMYQYAYTSPIDDIDNYYSLVSLCWRYHD